MENIKAEVNGKIRSAIKAKLMELGAYVDEELPDYIMVMVVNKRTKVQMEDDLQLFLGTNTEHFTVWLHQVLQKLEEVASLDKKAGKLLSSSDQEGAERKRKTSATSVDGDGHKKEKRKKPHDGKKSKKSICDPDKEREQKKDADSSVSLDAEKNQKSICEESNRLAKLNKEPVVSSSVDEGASSDVTLEQKSPAKNSSVKVGAKSAVVSSSQMDDELVQSTVDSNQRTFMLELELDKNQTKTTPKVSSTLSRGSNSQSLPKNKIVLMHSDEDDDDEDFINIKADAEAEALLNEELPKESNLVTPDALTSPSVEPLISTGEKPVSERSRKDPVGTTSELEQFEIPVGTFDRKRLPGKDLDQPEPSSLSLSERFARKRKVVKEAEDEDIRPIPATRVANPPPVLSIKDRLGVKKSIIVEPLDRPRQPVRITDRLGLRAVNIEPLKKRRMESGGLSPEPRSSAQSIEKVLRDRISRRVPNETNIQQDSSQGMQDQKKRPLLSRVVLPQPGREEEEYDPANPAVGSVASVVRVKPRPRLPAELQANKNLLLKAVAEAQKSVASMPIRPEPSSPVRRNLPDNIFTRRSRENNLACSLSNRRAQSFHDIQKRDSVTDRLVVPLKLDTPNFPNEKITIQVSSNSIQSSSDVKDGMRHITSSIRPKVGLRLEVDEEIDHTIEVRVRDEDEEMLPDEGIVTEELENEEHLPVVYPPVGLASRMPRERPQPQRSESPQFLVTLDGLDPSIFPSHSVDEDQCSPVKAEEEDEDQDDDSSKVSSAPSPSAKEKAKSVSPIVFTKRETSSEADNNLPKSLERCKYWPSCRLGTKCTFHHPNTPCKSFPKCPFREKCLYIHPMCKFDSSCTRRDCPFMHMTFNALTPATPASKFKLRTAARTTSSIQPSTQVCKFFPKCTNTLCRYLHPKPCRFGKFCSKPDCNYLHDELPPVDKLKWTSPFRT